MKQYSRFILILCMVFFFNAALPIFAHAQGPSDPCDDPAGPNALCPIDSGVILLLIAGAGYGIKKVIDSRKAPIIE